MRKLVTINIDRCGPLWRHVEARARWLDVCHYPRAYIGSGDVVMLATAARSIARGVLANCREADKALGFGPEPAEAAARSYLSQFAR